MRVYQGKIIGVLKKLQELLKLENKIYGYDTFDDHLEPSEYDISSLDNSKCKGYYFWKLARYEKWCFASLEKVENNLKSSTSDNIKIIDALNFNFDKFKIKPPPQQFLRNNTDEEML